MIELEPVGRVVGGRRAPEDDGWAAERAVIRLDARFAPEALAGLEAFSHLEVVFLFHLVDPARVATGARRPRGNPAWPEVGIFSQRAKDRPNRLGVSRCTLVRVDGLDVHVACLDAVDGTPVLDLKPHMSGFDARGEVR